MTEFVLVPKEPTEAMINKAAGFCDFSPEIYAVIYKTMLSASPTPPEAQGESVSVPAKGLMAIRDALVASDVEEAYHQLYYLVPWQDPFNPWAEWKALIPSIEQREG